MWKIVATWREYDGRFGYEVLAEYGNPVDAAAHIDRLMGLFMGNTGVGAIEHDGFNGFCVQSHNEEDLQAFGFYPRIYFHSTYFPT